MRPTYPLVCALIEPQEPEPVTLVKRAGNGRIRTYDLGSFTDYIARYTHSGVDQATVDKVKQFEKRNRGLQFNLENSMGQFLVASFHRRPWPVHIEGPLFDLHVEFVIYDPTEGGL